MKAYLHADAGHFDFQWNIDCSVGKGGQNNLRADVLYIQWYYQLAANQVETPPDRKAIYKQVGLTGMCNGTDADPLVRAITLHQRSINHPQVDGRVSVATAGGKVGASAFFVLRIGARIANMYPELWPRLEKIPGCPAEVAQASRLAIPHV
ncbi:hypothetical protein SAMN05216304_102772 [Bosea sp. OK403]|jgi:hypothetical protein|uniref:hypothetical protein n=1 Tax=Bosea sp. OK403 TaxID=1855286 RepID=UPI0008E3B61E|nr:hypothetical protein [Bosea sp. OK403]SFI44269.1 hypothetical protein SAMN05216304_102772 [Bosea sp. OK403]